MVLQAGAARQALDRQPEKAREPLLSVEATGRAAMSELRRLVAKPALRKVDDQHLATVHDAGDVDRAF